MSALDRAAGAASAPTEGLGRGRALGSGMGRDWAMCIARMQQMSAPAPKMASIEGRHLGLE